VGEGITAIVRELNEIDRQIAAQELVVQEVESELGVQKGRLWDLFVERSALNATYVKMRGD
jgi:hypothetical protein